MPRLVLLLLAAALAQAAEFQVASYGAKGDGRALDTTAIQKTIDAAAPAGGTVVFKPGIYLTGSLFLKSGVHFRVDEGVELHGVQDLAAYPVMFTRIAGIEMRWPAALLNVYEQANVKISGKGTIDGDGKIWWDKYWRMRREEYEPRNLRWAADYDCQRPRLIQIYKSSGVSLEGLTLKRSGFWTVHICFSRKVTVDGVTIRNNIGGRGPSTDGIDIDSSSDVLVQNCDIECNDDAICLKAGRDADGLRVNRPTERVVIHDNIVRDATAGLTFGSETSGGIREVEAYRIHVVVPTPVGVLFKSARTRGGTVENIFVHDIDAKGVETAFRVNLNWNPAYSYAKLPEGPATYPDYWRILATPVPAEQGMPHLGNVRVSNLRATDAREAFSVQAYPEAPIENFAFDHLDLHVKTAGAIRHARGWRFTDSMIDAADGSAVALVDSEKVEGLPKAQGTAARLPLRLKFGEEIPAAPYSKETGRGFDLGTSPVSKPFFYSVAMPEGNYEVNVTVGDAAAACDTSVRAEARRLMLMHVRTDPGRFETRSFAVNVRNGSLPGGGRVHLKPREDGSLDWDDKLTFEFTGPRPCLAALEISASPAIPTVFLAGDSTVTDQREEPYASWGQMLPRFFNSGIAVANHAESGESLKSFLVAGRLDKILTQIRRGDYLFIQFGHNDMKEDRPLTYLEPFTTYKAYLKAYLAEVRRRGATPVLVTPMHRRRFDANSKIVNTLGDYPAAMRQVAQEEHVALIDLHAMSAAFYEALGPEKSAAAFGAPPSDITHHSAYGAYELARCVIEGIRTSGLDLARFIAGDAGRFDPARPDAP